MALREDLAAYLGHGLTAGEVWAANGSNEVIQQLLQAFGGPGRAALGFEPSYSMHPLIARATGTGWIAAAATTTSAWTRTGRAARSGEHQPDVVFLTSPNNPTGTALPLAVIEAVCEAAPGMVVVDEAYAEFRRTGTPSALALLPELPAAGRHPDHVQGVRAGRARGSATWPPTPADQALLLVRLPYHLSAVTQAVARAALAHAQRPAGQRGRAARRARPAAWPGCAAWAWPWPTPTPTSCCSASSPTGTRSGRACWTAAC